jgi:hypothetical protein
MAKIKQNFSAIGSKRNSATPLKRAPKPLAQPRQTLHKPHRLLGEAFAVNRANPTAPAGSDPANVSLLTSLQTGRRRR